MIRARINVDLSRPGVGTRGKHAGFGLREVSITCPNGSRVDIVGTDDELRALFVGCLEAIERDAPATVTQ